MKIELIAVSLALLLLAACASRQMAAPKIVPQTAPAVQPPASADAAVSDIEKSTADVDQMSKDLDTSEIDKLDTDLAAVDNLDLG